MRKFKSGATRDEDETKIDPEGFLNPLVVEAFSAYMHKHRFQADGEIRPSDNWQKGIPRDAYMKSMWRHFLDVWRFHRYPTTDEEMMESLCALLFNVQGYLFEVVKSNSETNPLKDQ